MNEEQTKRDYIDPKLREAGWEQNVQVRVLMEHKLNDGRIQIGGKRAQPKFADYVLEYKNKKLAVVEAKKLGLGYAEGLAQAKEYGQMLGIDFVYATDGQEIYEYSLKANSGKLIDSFPTPEELWQKTFSEHNKWKEIFAQTPFGVSGTKSPRYYQEIAVNRVLEAVAEDKNRILLTLATGTGKTYIASQIAYKLYEAKWNLQKDANRRPRILFLADRNTLADQALADFDIFTDDQKTRITPAEIRKANNELPHNATVFFTIFQTLTGENGDERHFEKYDPDFFDFVIIDECHRGGANDESSWREILEYFAPAYQLGLTATPKRKDNVDTYEYFGHPVYQYSLKQGIGDGFLTPFRVKKFTTSLDEYIYTSDDEIAQGEVEEGKIYKESDFNRVIEIEEREMQRVKEMMESINQNEKTIVFCANQKHAAFIRDLINNYADSNNPDYCVRVTANDGQRGENFLKQFRNNEETIPTILTTSQKLSTGVDAKNVRNIVLFRPVNSMIEFKQIVGRGTRVFDGKNYFTILDFVKAYYHFSDPEWDGEPLDQTTGKKEQNISEEQENNTGDTAGNEDQLENKKGKIKVVLGDGKKREMWAKSTTMFYSADGTQVSAEEFLKGIFGTLPEFFSDEEKLKEIWLNPKTRESFLKELENRGYDKAQLKELAKMVGAENSDLFDLFEYIAFDDKKPISRGQRILQSKEQIFAGLNDEEREFVEFVLRAYHKSGVDELAPEKLSEYLRLKYGSEIEGVKVLGDVQRIHTIYLFAQKKLYQEVSVDNVREIAV